MRNQVRVNFRRLVALVALDETPLFARYFAPWAWAFLTLRTLLDELATDIARLWTDIAPPCLLLSRSPYAAAAVAAIPTTQAGPGTDEDECSAARDRLNRGRAGLRKAIGVVGLELEGVIWKALLPDTLAGKLIADMPPAPSVCEASTKAPSSEAAETAAALVWHVAAERADASAESGLSEGDALMRRYPHLREALRRRASPICTVKERVWRWFAEPTAVTLLPGVLLKRWRLRVATLGGGSEA